MPPYCPILATLGYILSEDRNSVLLVHRNKRPDDIHFGKYNGLGGKLEHGEDIVSGMRREILEEAGIYAEQLHLRGTINWPGFGKDGQDWFGFVFLVDKWAGNALSENSEGTLEWIKLSELGRVNFWESDRHWLDMVFDSKSPTFHGIAPFSGGKMVSWDCQRLDTI